MRILHVIPSLDPGDGGPSKAVVEICQALKIAGENVEIAATGKAPAPAGIPTHLFSRKGKLEYKYSPDLAAWLDAEVKHYDVLHVHAVFNHSTHAAAAAGWKRGVPYIVRPLGTLNESYSLQQKAWKKRWYLRFVARRELDRAAALHCTSEPEAEDLRRLGLRPPKVVIPHGLRTEEFEHLPARGTYRQGDELVIAFLGRVHHKKGFDLLLPALETLAKRYAFRMVIAGPGDPAYVAKLKAEADRRGIAGRITWPGILNGPAKLSLLADADIFVLPSYNENFGLAVAEAMACGVPVVVSDQVDLCIEVHDARAGLVITCDTHEVARALGQMLDDPAMRVEMGANGRQFVARTFRWETVAAKLKALYAGAISGRIEE